MATRYFGARIKRNEDRRLLTGSALFVDDVELPEMLHAAFVRSPHAHARIQNLDVSAARCLDGVVAVYTADDLGPYWRPGARARSRSTTAGSGSKSMVTASTASSARYRVRAITIASGSPT